MKLGIVGLPNVGKSTLFNALTSTQNAQAANYPFCTIEPNSGIVPVPDARLDKLAEIWQTDKKTPAIVEFVDIAGLVKGASQGAGLGNKFLGHIRECDAIVHVVRCFDDDNIIHVVEDVNKPESVDPIRDIDAIDLELILADLEVVSNRLGRQQKAAKTGNKTAAAEAAWLAELAAHLEGGKPARSFAFDPDDDSQNTARKELGLLSAKPVIYACNVGEDDLLGGLDENPYYPLVAARAKEENAQAIPICAKTEEDIAAYLEAVMEDGGDDPAYVARALGVVARARNMTALAREVGMSRVGLNKALSGDGNPTLSTVMKVAKALGLKVSIQPGA